jgi:hypothetical protein
MDSSCDAGAAQSLTAPLSRKAGMKFWVSPEVAGQPELMLGTGLHRLDRWAAGEGYRRDLSERAMVQRVHPATEDDLKQERATGAQTWQVIASYTPRPN